MISELIKYGKFLGGGGGSGGAQSDWNAKEGEPGHVLNRPFYTEYGDPIVLLPETTLTVMEEMDGMGVLPEVLDISAGMVCAVMYNGTEYECDCIEYNMDGTTAYLLGNTMAIGEADTGEPFLITALPAEMVETMGIPGGVWPLDGSTEFTISITDRNATIHPIPPKYLPELKNQKSILLDLDSGECNVPFEEVENMSVDELRNALQVYSTDSSITHTVLNIQKTISEISGIEVISFELWVLNNSTTEIRQWLWNMYTFGGSTHPLTFAPVTDGEANRKDPLYMVAYGGRRWFCSGYLPLKSEGGKYFKLLVNDDGTLFTEEIETPV